MTQEELNELILSKFDDDEIGNETNKNIKENPFKDDSKVAKNSYENPSHKVNVVGKWSPPPPTNEHKIIHQLDDVTKGLETKATQIFDQLESISQNSKNMQDDLKIIKTHIEKQKKLIEKLSVQFPHIKAFRESLESSNDVIERIATIEEKTIDTTNRTIQAIDILQYQDIYRQKIEKVINVIRVISKYLNSIFDTNIKGDKPEKLVSSLGKK